MSFAYTPEEIQRGLVSRYTSTMALAQDAGDSAAILAGTHKPVGVWIGSNDEVFDANTVIDFAKHAQQVTAVTITGADHLGVIDGSVTAVGTWLNRQSA